MHLFAASFYAVQSKIGQHRKKLNENELLCTCGAQTKWCGGYAAELQKQTKWCGGMDSPLPPRDWFDAHTVGAHHFPAAHIILLCTLYRFAHLRHRRNEMVKLCCLIHMLHGAPFQPRSYKWMKKKLVRAIHPRTISFTPCHLVQSHSIYAARLHNLIHSLLVSHSLSFTLWIRKKQRVNEREWETRLAKLNDNEMVGR